MEAMESVDILNTSMEIKSAEKIIVEHSTTENRIPSKFANYDVFISHRGPDTKTGFVGYFYEALKARGLLTFLDCRSIEMGEDAWRSIENAIKSSKIAVVVFSEGFASSPWCLKELDAILDTPSIKVRVIFYKVRPSEVKHPESGQLKNAFEKLSERHEKSVIEHWKKRLEETSQLMGWELPSDSRRSEVDFLSEVVGDILTCANKPLPLNVGDCAVGVKQVAEELIQILQNEKEVLMLGLWGMGGIGKSTLAKELYNKMSPRYDSSCFIEDVYKVVHHGGIKTVQQQIMKDLCKNDPKDIDGKSKGETILKERLSNIRFLLVLDDIQDNDVMEHCVLREMFSEGSMCIVTSRDRSILKISPSRRASAEREVYIHDVQGLNITKSKKVLKFHAFKDCRMINSEYEKLVSSISERCGGVPLVVKVIGAFLRGREVKIWNEMVEKLNAGATMDEKNLLKCLQISFDGLSEEHQEMFLDIACALIGECKDFAARIWKFGKLGIQILVEKALITVDEKGLLKMHDHLRDMGRKIERKNIERRRMWMHEALTLLKRKKRLPPSLQALNLSFGRGDIHGDKDHIIDLDVSHMTDLRILVCDDQVKILPYLPRSTHWFSFTGRKYGAKLNIPSIPEYSELTVLVLRDARVYDLLPSVRDLSKLKVLDLARCELQLHFWEIWNLLCIFRELSNLEVLNLSFCGKPKLFESLIDKWDDFWYMGLLGGLGGLKYRYSRNPIIRSLPNTIGMLSNLEVLNLSYSCENLIMLPDSIGGLKKLRDLQLCHSGITSLPNTFGELSNLEVLDLSECRLLIMLPDSFGSLKKLHNLQLESSGVRSLPDTFGELSNLEVLNLSYSCENLIMLPDSIGGLKNLRDLQLCHSGITSLPNTFGELSSLEVLDLSECRLLIMIPDSFGSLKKLHNLQLESSGVRSLPDTFGELSNLEVLNLSYLCENLIMLPDSIGGLKKLRNLQLESSGVRSLPNTFGELSNLEVLNLGSCKELTMLPEAFGGLKKLRDLKLYNSGITRLPNTFGELSNLEVLDLGSCKELTMLPEAFGGLKKLCDLKLYNSGITRLPNTFGELSNLEVLNLSYSCENLIMLSDSIGGLKKLRNLQLESSGVRSLPNTFGELSNLEVLNLGSCKELTMLPEAFGGLKKLRDLKLYNSGITRLPNTFGELSNLEVLDLGSCKELTMLPEAFGGLKKLCDLKLYNSGITRLPNTFGELSNLEVLNLSYSCENLIMLSDSIGGLKKLRNLQLESSGVRSLPNTFGELSNLEVLNLGSCKELTMLPEAFGGLKKLRDLKLYNSGITRLPNTFGELSNLEVLDLGSCKELTMLPEAFGGLKKLCDLKLYNSGITRLPNTFGELSNLEVLNLGSCKKLTMLPDSFGGLKKLHKLILYD